MVTFISWHKYPSLSLFLIGLSCVFAQAPFNILPVLIVAYGLLGYYLLHHVTTPYDAFKKGYVFGAGYFIGTLHWIGNALLTDSQFFYFLPLAYLGLPCALGLFYGGASFLFRKICPPRCSSVKHILLLTLCLAGADILRGFIFTGFPWNLPVYSTAFYTPLMQISYYLGCYGYNALIILLSVSSVILYTQKPLKNNQAFMVYLILWGVLGVIGQYHIDKQSRQDKSSALFNNKNTIYRIVQPNIALKWVSDKRQENFNKLLDLSAQNRDETKHYVIIWPETALPFHPEQDKNAFRAINTILNHNQHELIAGKMYFEPKALRQYDFYNSVYYMSDGIWQKIYDKIHLVPFGEYLPLEFILKKIGFQQINHFKNGFQAGQYHTITPLKNHLKIGIQICYEMIFPQYSRILQQKSADVIITLTNDAWFGNSFGPHQHLAQARFRAVETGLPVIRSANTGISAFIDSTGHIIKSLDLNHTGTIDLSWNDYER